MGHPDYAYKPWSEERRHAARVRALARIGRSCSEFQAMLREAEVERAYELVLADLYRRRELIGNLICALEKYLESGQALAPSGSDFRPLPMSAAKPSTASDVGSCGSLAGQTPQ